MIQQMHEQHVELGANVNVNYIFTNNYSSSRLIIVIYNIINIHENDEMMWER